jgi:hypothetical protein
MSIIASEIAAITSRIIAEIAVNSIICSEDDGLLTLL